MADAGSFELRHSAKDGGVDPFPVPTKTADSGTVNTIVDAALTEADDFWNGAIVKWISGPNVGIPSSVKDFDAASDTITLDEDLPSAVAVGHDYKLFLSHGGFMSDEEVEHLSATAPVSATGLVDKRRAGENGEGDGTLEHIFNGGGGAEALRWTAPGDTAGSQVVVGGGDGDYRIFSNDLSKWIEYTVTIASLPGGDTSETITLSQPRHQVQGPISGTENAAGLTRYESKFALNNHPSDKIFTVLAFLETGLWVDGNGDDQTAAATTVDTGGYAASGADTIPLVDASSYPPRGHILNTDTNEIMQYNSRDGNDLTVTAAGRGIRGSSESAGSATDNIVLLPPIDIGIEAPGGGGDIQTISDENTAPAAIAFSAPIDESGALSIGDLDFGEKYGIWFRETVIPDGVPQLNITKPTRFTFDVA